eukprot:Phypoly_transcript_03696.p1 GENE.Phypoly_transcript_03696~~Phypoly_transcript_03696.p1  ORF type:complete len:741 (+),score=176.56 Phypoly_transcript_03696:153-2375(+)
MAQKGEFVYVLEVFNRMKNEDDMVPSTALVQYFSDLGMAEEWVKDAMRKIDVNNDNYLSWPEFGTKIKLINQMRAAHELEKLKVQRPPVIKALPTEKEGEGEEVGKEKREEKREEERGMPEREVIPKWEIGGIEEEHRTIVIWSEDARLRSEGEEEGEEGEDGGEGGEEVEEGEGEGEGEGEEGEGGPVEIKVDLGEFISDLNIDKFAMLAFELLVDKLEEKEIQAATSYEESANARHLSDLKIQQEKILQLDSSGEAAQFISQRNLHLLDIRKTMYELHPKEIAPKPEPEATNSIEPVPKKENSNPTLKPESEKISCPEPAPKQPEILVSCPKSECKFSSKSTDTVSQDIIAEPNLEYKHADKPTPETAHSVPQSADFVASLLNSETSLITRGYTVIELPHQIVSMYKILLKEYQGFVQTRTECRQKSPTDKASTDSEFQLRLCGKRTSVTTPSSIKGDKGEDMGKFGMELHEQMDQICRNFVKGCLQKDHVPLAKLDFILDPIQEIGAPAQREPFTPEICYSSYVPEGYISSSVLEISHAQPRRACTDGGLLTAAITSDVAGLEIFDQELRQWIAIEQLIHEYAPRANKYHSQFAILFWGKSASYLKGPPGFQPCEYRIRKGEKERYAIELKQRATPLTTPCLNKADQKLLETQLNAAKHARWSRGSHFFSPPPSPPSTPFPLSSFPLLSSALSTLFSSSSLLSSLSTSLSSSPKTPLLAGVFVVGAIVGAFFARKIK